MFLIGTVKNEDLEYDVIQAKCLVNLILSPKHPFRAFQIKGHSLKLYAYGAGLVGK